MFVISADALPRLRARGIRTRYPSRSSRRCITMRTGVKQSRADQGDPQSRSVHISWRYVNLNFCARRARDVTRILDVGRFCSWISHKLSLLTLIRNADILCESIAFALRINLNSE